MGSNPAARSPRRKYPVGKGAVALRWKVRRKRLKYFAVTVFAIFLSATVAGIVLGGIGFNGIVLVFLAIVAAAYLFTRFPRVKTPQRADLARTQDARQLVARTELWLEHQRPALPPPAIRLVDEIGGRLDELGLQLEGIGRNHPAAVETRKLVGEHLPQTIDSYRKIPAELRSEPRAIGSPDEQVVESLRKISGEIDRVTRQLASGAIDDLAIRTRYLEYRYGEALDPAGKDN